MARVKVYDTATQSWVYADKSFGKDGTSVTVASVVESAEDGGSNVVTFSDGKTVTIKNGNPGLVWRGEYDVSIGYSIGDVVSQDGSCYVAVMNNGGDEPSAAPDEDTGEWELLASKGDKGNPGKDGHNPVVGTDYFTATDKADIVAQVKAELVTETWVFTLEDGTTVEKEVLLG